MTRLGESLREEAPYAFARRVGIGKDDDAAPLVRRLDVGERTPAQREAARHDAVGVERLSDGDDIHLSFHNKNFFQHIFPFHKGAVHKPASTYAQPSFTANHIPPSTGAVLRAAHECTFMRTFLTGCAAPLRKFFHAPPRAKAARPPRCSGCAASRSARQD